MAAAQGSVVRKVMWTVVIVIGFFVLLEGALAVVGVQPERYARDPYVGFAGTSRLFVPADDGSGDLVTAVGRRRLFNLQRFPATRPTGEFRIFCVGGSTTYGRPYDDATSFCGWLRELLPVADPSRRWRVVNAGGVSYASYRVALLMEELIDYEPDLFVIYSGHNEFLEERTYRTIIATPPAVRGLGSIAAKTRVWTVLAAAIRTTSGAPTDPVDSADLLDEEVTTALDKSVGPDAYTRNDVQSARIFDHFRFNLTRMVDIAASVDAGALLVVPASNLRDSRPFKSEHRDGLGEADLRRFDDLVAEARAAYSEGRLDAAVESIQAAAAIDPRHAQLAYLEGRLLYSDARWRQARTAFVRARDEDVCPLRAPSPIADIVRAVAADRDTGLVDFEVRTDEWAEHAIPGSDLFLDHVHPTIEVHRRLAVDLIAELADLGVVTPSPDWGAPAVAEVARRVEAGIEPIDHALALMKLSKVLGWAGKLQESYALSRQAAEIFPDDARIQYNAGLNAHLVGRKGEAVEHYRRAIELQPDADEPHGNLGVLLEEAGRFDEAELHYRAAIQYARTEATRARNQANLDRLLAKMRESGG